MEPRSTHWLVEENHRTQRHVCSGPCVFSGLVGAPRFIMYRHELTVQYLEDIRNVLLPEPSFAAFQSAATHWASRLASRTSRCSRLACMTSAQLHQGYGSWSLRWPALSLHQLGVLLLHHSHVLPSVVRSLPRYLHVPRFWAGLIGRWTFQSPRAGHSSCIGQVMASKVARVDDGPVWRVWSCEPPLSAAESGPEQIDVLLFSHLTRTPRLTWCEMFAQITVDFCPMRGLLSQASLLADGPRTHGASAATPFGSTPWGANGSVDQRETEPQAFRAPWFRFGRIDQCTQPGPSESGSPGFEIQNPSVILRASERVPEIHQAMTS